MLVNFYSSHDYIGCASHISAKQSAAVVINPWNSVSERELVFLNQICVYLIKLPVNRPSRCYKWWHRMIRYKSYCVSWYINTPINVIYDLHTSRLLSWSLLVRKTILSCNRKQMVKKLCKNIDKFIFLQCLTSIIATIIIRLCGVW